MKANHVGLRSSAQRRGAVIAVLVSAFLLVPQLVSAKAAASGDASALAPRRQASQQVCNPLIDLRGTLSAGGQTGTIVNNSTTCTYEVGIASYRLFDYMLVNQVLFDSTAAVVKPGETVRLEVDLPDCKAQVDLFAGKVVESFRDGNYFGRLLAAILTGGEFCENDEDDGCTLTQGFYKNHPEDWPVDTLRLGSRIYTKAELLAILRTPVRGNGLISLAHQLIAAKLNLANGASANGIAGAILTADALIGARVVGQASLSSSSTSRLVELLDDFNNGVTGPGHCDDEGDDDEDKDDDDKDKDDDDKDKDDDDEDEED